MTRGGFLFFHVDLLGPSWQLRRPDLLGDAGLGEARLGWGVELGRRCLALGRGGGLDGLCVEPELACSPVTSGARSQQALLEAGQEEGCPGERGGRSPSGFSVWHEGEGRATDGEVLPLTSVNLFKVTCRRKEKPLEWEGADPAWRGSHLSAGTMGEHGVAGMTVVWQPRPETGDENTLGLLLRALGAVQEAPGTLRFLPLRPLESDPCSLQSKAAFGEERAQSLDVRHHLGKGCQQTCLVLGAAQGWVRAQGPCLGPCRQRPPMPLTASRRELCLTPAAPAPARSHHGSPESRGAASSPNA